MNIRLPYGARDVTATLDWGRCLGILDVADTPALPNTDAAIRTAIENPIGLDRNIYDLVAPGETVVILVSDMFRETHADRVLPVLIEGLNRAGIPDEAVHLLFATGTHRAPTRPEQIALLGPRIYDRFERRIAVHDPTDTANLVPVGVTSRGTPVFLNRQAWEADRLIATGAVVLHYFGGFGGGRKSVVPGIASTETIAHNHAMNLDPQADRLNPAVRIGVLDGNPVAEDMLEAAQFAGVDYIINTVLNRDGDIAGVFAGALDEAHRAAAHYACELFAVTISEPADLVIASSGDAKNFVQSHKALYNAYQAVKPEGRIVFVSRCEEGLGGEPFVQWLRLGNRQTIVAALRKHAEINGQTALSTLEKAPRAVLVTELSDAEVRLLGARKAASLEQALETVRADLAGIRNPTYYVMPSAAYCVPFLIS